MAKKDPELKEIRESYEKDGYLDEDIYNLFINLKNKKDNVEILKSQESDQISSLTKTKTHKITPGHTLIKIPCPHCNFLCSSKVRFCKKCGEPLPKLKNLK